MPYLTETQIEMGFAAQRTLVALRMMMEKGYVVQMRAGGGLVTVAASPIIKEPLPAHLVSGRNLNAALQELMRVHDISMEARGESDEGANQGCPDSRGSVGGAGGTEEHTGADVGFPVEAPA